MSLGNVIFMTLYCILCVSTGITEAIESYAEQATYSLADEAHFHKFELEIRSSQPQWYHEGIQIFAFGHSPYYWTKRNLTWTFYDDPVVMPTDIAIEAIQAACDKWTAASPITFRRVSQFQQPDIRIEVVWKGSKELPDVVLVHNPHQLEKDREGVTLKFYRIPYWAGSHSQGGTNFRFEVLYQMGRILGLGDSEVPGAVMHVNMNAPHPGYTLPLEYELTNDDIAGIRAKYPVSITRTTGPLDSSDDSSSSSDPPSPTGIFDDLAAR